MRGIVQGCRKEPEEISSAPFRSPSVHELNYCAGQLPFHWDTSIRPIADVMVIEELKRKSGTRHSG